jgi:hypothetical protein
VNASEPRLKFQACHGPVPLGIHPQRFRTAPRDSGRATSTGSWPQTCASNFPGCASISKSVPPKSYPQAKICFKPNSACLGAPIATQGARGSVLTFHNPAPIPVHCFSVVYDLSTGSGSEVNSVVSLYVDLDRWIGLMASIKIERRWRATLHWLLSFMILKKIRVPSLLC